MYVKVDKPWLILKLKNREAHRLKFLSPTHTALTLFSAWKAPHGSPEATMHHGYDAPRSATD